MTLSEFTFALALALGAAGVVLALGLPAGSALIAAAGGLVVAAVTAS